MKRREGEEKVVWLDRVRDPIAVIVRGSEESDAVSETTGERDLGRRALALTLYSSSFSVIKLTEEQADLT